MHIIIYKSTSPYFLPKMPRLGDDSLGIIFFSFLIFPSIHPSFRSVINIWRFTQPYLLIISISSVLFLFLNKKISFLRNFSTGKQQAALHWISFFNKKIFFLRDLL